jgi:hypothetical protein
MATSFACVNVEPSWLIRTRQRWNIDARPIEKQFKKIAAILTA